MKTQKRALHAEAKTETTADISQHLNQSKQFNFSFTLSRVLVTLRFSESVLEETPEEWIEWTVVKCVRSGLDAGTFLPEPSTLAEKFNLNPVFQEILNDPTSKVK